MQKVKIGVMDSEKRYVEKLVTFLDRHGQGRWRVSGFTDGKMLERQLADDNMDVVLTTDKNLLLSFTEKYERPEYLWLSDAAENVGRAVGFRAVNQYQSAKTIAGMVEKLVVVMRQEESAFLVAIYSPVGRCGKTSLAWEVVEGEAFGDWLWLCMEDYPSVPLPPAAGDMLFFIKERREEKALELLSACDGKLVLSPMPFEMRELDREDVRWFRGVVGKSRYSGVIFDMGTGTIENYDIFSAFDRIVVPYLPGDAELVKRDNFKKLLGETGRDDMVENFVFLDMENRRDVERVRQEVFVERN